MLDTKITDLFSKSAFVKVKNEYFDIGQVLFSFVKTEKGKSVASIDCCLTFGEALEFALSIIQGRVTAKLTGGSDEAWKSSIGGVHEEDAKRRGLRNDGLAVARWFSIQSANVGWARFTATQKGGRTDKQGLIVPVDQGDKTYINVPIPSEERLRAMAMEILVGITAYQSSGYTLGWEALQRQRQEERAKARESISANGSSETSGGNSQKAPEIVVTDCYYCVAKGSFMEKRGKNNEATMLRMVVPKISDNEPNILASDDRWQLVDVLFYQNSIQKAGKDLSEQIKALLAKVESGYEQANLKGITLKVGDVRDGYRQLVFKS